jgi:lipopolysaccharide/colanic/teichoic acid biosynthesis glycosyltransferase
LYKKYFKRILDLTAATLGLLVLSPVLLLVMLLLLLFNNGQVFFTQVRPGLNERLFKVIKFKTLNDNTDAAGQLLQDEDRLTFLGKIIRTTSIDELPQLINVLVGDMSLIGPRPLLVEYLPLYSQEQRRRHLVRPGITGWAQVNGRNLVEWPQRFEMDTWYVDHVSFLLDLKIIYLTVINIVLAKGIRGEGSVTMKKFEGN